jgi:polysaccharide export outer membrane protein
VRGSIALVVSFLLLTGGCATQPRTANTGGVGSPKAEAPARIVIKEFQLGPGDVVEITVWRNDDLTRRVQVSSAGNISYPLIGSVQAGGLSVFELRDSIAEGLSEYLVDPQVGLEIVSYESNKIMTLGEVNRPGVFQSMGRPTALEAISMAGGFTRDAEPRTVLLIRGDIDSPELITLNLRDTLKEGDVSQNVILMPGDVLYVPASVFASAERIFARLDNIIRPIVRAEMGIILGDTVGDILSGEDFNRNIVISP